MSDSNKVNEVIDSWLKMDIPMFRISKFQTDNEGFKRPKYRESIESCAGKLITNAPYSPETMAIIERSWRTIGEMASFMLLNADLGKVF